MSMTAAIRQVEPIEEELARVDILGRASPADLKTLAAASRPLHLPSRRVVFTQGEPCKAVYALLSGGVKLERREGGGPAQVVGLIEPTSLFGEAGLLGRCGHPVSAVTYRTSELVAVDAPAVRRWLRSHPRAFERVLGHLCESLERQLSDSYVRSALSAEQRVASYLLGRHRAAGSGGIAVDRGVSRRDIANLLGIAPETLSRVLHAFREREWIVITEGRIQVCSGSGLAGTLP